MEAKFLDMLNEVSNPNVYIMANNLIKTSVTGVALLITGEIYDNKEGFWMFLGIFFFLTCPAIIAASILVYNDNQLIIVNDEKEMKL